MREEEENLESNDEERVAGHTTKSYGIAIDPGLIPSVPVDEQASVLRNLGVNVFNQDEFEEGVLKQVDQAIAVKETEEIVKGWEKNLKAVNEDIKTVEKELLEINKILQGLEGKIANSHESWHRSQAIQKQRDNKLRQLKKLQATQRSLHHKLGIGDEGEHDLQVQGEIKCDGFDQDQEINKLPLVTENHSEKDVLVKKGEMTPFGGTVENARGSHDLQSVATALQGSGLQPESGVDEPCLNKNRRTQEGCQAIRSLADDRESNGDDDGDDDEYLPDDGELKYSWYEEDDEEGSGRMDVRKGKKWASTSKHSLNIAYREDDACRPKKKRKTKKGKMKTRTRPIDDGSEKIYRQRIRELRIKELLKKRRDSQVDDGDDEELPDMEFDKGLKVPGKIWHKLYKYQQTGVQWLWELHCQQAGGVIGDEMGLGKTIQIIAFLAGLKYSKISVKKSKRGGLGPVLIVCPVTVLHQWVQEFHRWWPEFRVAVLHETGTYQGFKVYSHH